MKLAGTALSLMLLTLGGCAIQRGEILGRSPLDYKDTSFVRVPEDEYFWIAPPAEGRHGVRPASMQIPRSGLWIREGWFMVEFQCFTPRDRPVATDPILPETDDQKPVFLYAGHRYLLSCSATKVGDMDVAEDTATPAG